MGIDHFYLEDECDFSEESYFPVNDPHVITCFEMLEHSSPAKVLKILDNISASVEKKEAFKKHLKENNYIFIVQSFSENSSVPTQINKLLGKKS